jgi:hypothetical protein
VIDQKHFPKANPFTVVVAVWGVVVWILFGGREDEILFRGEEDAMAATLSSRITPALPLNTVGFRSWKLIGVGIIGTVLAIYLFIA